MDYFEILLKEIDDNISFETEKMLSASRALQESTETIEELKHQKNVVLGLSSKVTNAY
jgi:hypothetical protein